MLDSAENAFLVRCLFCQTREEPQVVKRIQDNGLGIALFPQKIEPFYRKGLWKDIKKPLLPGYVFVYSAEVYPVQHLLGISGVIRHLTYGTDDTEGYLNGMDCRFAQWLLENEGIVHKLQAIREGSYVHIVDGLLRDYNGRVEKIDKQKRMAYLSLDIIGTARHIWLGFQYLEETALQARASDQ